jgi:hypothetical protein
MRHISETVYGMLMSQGLRAGSLAGDDAHGMGAGMLEGTAHPLAAQAGENREPMGMERAGAAKAPASQQEVGKRQVKLGRSGDSFLWLIADNVDVVPTRQRRGDVRLSLVRT